MLSGGWIVNNYSQELDNTGEYLYYIDYKHFTIFMYTKINKKAFFYSKKKTSFIFVI